MGVRVLHCAAQVGFVANIVEVEVSFTRALPAFCITGLAGGAIQESKQRVQSSLLANDFHFPPLKITVNLSPSDLPKQGSFFDLPIALLIALYDHCDIKGEMLEGVESSKETEDSSIKEEIKYFAFGELGLDGRIKDSNSIYPLLFSLLSRSKKDNFVFILPKEGKEFYSKIPHLKAYFAESLKEAIEILKDPPPLESFKAFLPFKHILINDEPFYYSSDFALDFYEIVGQDRAKRAALIAACGFHNILFEGSAGSGKSMISSRIPYILPPLSIGEILELAANSLKIEPTRPFRNPHHSTTIAAILGSCVGQVVKPGEIGLANHGVLFFDELPHFKRSLLESLREPLENHNFTLSRAQVKAEYPADFMFVGAMNPCPCGNLLSLNKECRCNQKEINAYKNRISEPFWDRIDLFVNMQEGVQSSHRVASKELQEKVLKAFVMQKSRGQSCFNARLSGAELERFCALEADGEAVLQKAIDRFGLSRRSVNKILRVARSIADLENAKTIAKEHLLEALSYRKI